MSIQKQLNHSETKQIQPSKKHNIIFVLDNFDHMENIGSAFRLADAFNVDSTIIVSGGSINFKKVSKTARNCERSVKFEIVATPRDALELLAQKGYTPINLEITSTSKPLREVEFSTINNIALIVGNENHGVCEYFLESVPLSAHIEMYGNNSSLNVATALAIATYHICEKS